MIYVIFDIYVGKIFLKSHKKKTKGEQKETTTQHAHHPTTTPKQKSMTRINWIYNQEKNNNQLSGNKFLWKKMSRKNRY